jgi:hypothetical protein
MHANQEFSNQCIYITLTQLLKLNCLLTMATYTNKEQTMVYLNSKNRVAKMFFALQPI